MVSVDDYKKALLACYMHAKNGEYAEYLLEPTPARFKRLSIVLLNDVSADIEIYKRFFIFKDNEPLFKQIENFDTDKFKPLCNFVKGKSELTNLNSIDLLAILVGFSPRPYVKFRNGGITNTTNATAAFASNFNGGLQKANFADTVTIKKGSSAVKLMSNESAIEDSINRRDLLEIVRDLNSNRVLYNLLLLGLGISIFFGVKNTFFKQESCMAWKVDHYEEVPCIIQQGNGFAGIPIVPLDKETFTFQRKIQVTDTTTFFLPNGMPCIWYYKTGEGSIEYFTYPGLHPVTGRTLKKITPYMINKYVKHKD